MGQHAVFRYAGVGCVRTGWDDVADKHSVLAMVVAGGPACSVELQARLFERVGMVGSTREVVERSLIELCLDGFVEATGELRDLPFGSRAERAVFAVTTAGHEELERWRESPIDFSQLLADDPLAWFPRSYAGREQITALIDEAARREHRCRTCLAGYVAVPDERIDDVSRPIHDVLRDLSFNRELEVLEKEADTLARLQELLRAELAELDEERH